VTHPAPEGLFITFEGIDRCGKSTQAALLRDALLAQGENVGFVGTPGGVLREPGGTRAGERIRDQLLHGAALAPETEALLYAAARAELVDRVLRPSLAAGFTVILDRYVDSSLAYQGFARGLGIERIADLNAWATGGLAPRLTLLIDVSPEVAATRGGAEADRIEAEGIAFQRLVAEGYAHVARREPERMRVVAGDRTPDQIAADVLGAVIALREADRV
jgi:dTMP kinase